MQSEDSGLKPAQKEDESLLNKEVDIEKNEEQPLLHAAKPSTQRDSNLKWLVLILGITTCIGSYYCGDNPQALQVHIQDIFQVGDAGFNVLYSIGLLPNAIIPFLGGIAIDVIGVRRIMVSLSLIIVAGQAVVTYGASRPDFEIMILGRLIFGLGYQTFENCLLIIVTKWFLLENRTLAWGSGKSFLRLFNALNSFLSPRLYVRSGQLYTPFLFGLYVTIVSCVAACILAYVDKKAEGPQREILSESDVSEGIRLEDLKQFPRLYYLMMVVGVLCYSSFYSFTNNVNSLLVRRFGFNSESAGSVIAMLYLIAAILSPIVGMTVDKFGKRKLLILGGIISIFIGQLIFLVLEDSIQPASNFSVVFGLIALGAFYSIFSTVFWTSMSLIIKHRDMATGIGIVTCASSAFQAILTESIGLIHDHSLDSHNGYYWTQALQCVIAFIALGFGIAVYFDSSRASQKLQNKNKKMEEKDF